VKVGVYALAKNESKHAFDWASSCRDADVRVVTDTGSGDGTVPMLEACGVTVARGYVCPWRWDDAHNLSLNHLPPDIDVCVRLDLDERLQPGWREAIYKAWTDGVNQLNYRYVWGWEKDGRPGMTFAGDRVHSRHGWRWVMATHEGLTMWSGTKKTRFAPGLEIHHHRDAGKSHSTDLTLLEVAVREAPHDSRALWYLGRQLDYANDPRAGDTFRKYLEMPGTATERSYAMRMLAKITGDELWLHKAASQAPAEPDAWLALALANYGKKRWREVLAFADRAMQVDGPPTHCVDPRAKAKAADLASIASWELGLREQALTLARQALRESPQDERLANNVAAIERLLA